ncbi:MAG: NAD(P)-binding domain-containing protein [Thaumarchaeota archaeon]|nr:NAD(P)-binding domain-containing protein [Nitrososphaerota archaeon]
MKVGILGGTGAMGAGLATHLVRRNKVMLGSRSTDKARSAAAKIEGVSAGSYEEAARWCDVAIVAVPYSSIGALQALAGPLSGKLVISIVNPLRLEGGVLQYSLEEGSAAERLASLLPKSRIAAAFNNVPVAFFRKAPSEEVDVLVAADTRETFQEVAGLVKNFAMMRPVYVGPLTQAQSVERLTVMVLNAAKLSGGPKYSVRFVS